VWLTPGEGIEYGLREIAGASTHSAGILEAHRLRALRSEEAFMESWRWQRVLVATAVGGSLLTLAGSAIGAGGKGRAGKGPAAAKIVIKGAESFKPNAYIKIGFRFAPGTVPIHSGGTVTLTNTTADPHTLSLVTRSQLPRTFKQVESCDVCGAIAKSHGLNPEGPPTGPPPIPLVNVGAAGFDAPGDSVIIGPKGEGPGPVTFKVTARPGTILSFVCAIHPWMQGRFLVK
jgi:plastocyanin